MHRVDGFCKSRQIIGFFADFVTQHKVSVSYTWSSTQPSHENIGKYIIPFIFIEFLCVKSSLSRERPPKFILFSHRSFSNQVSSLPMLAASIFWVINKLNGILSLGPG